MRIHGDISVIEAEVTTFLKTNLSSEYEVVTNYAKKDNLGYDLAIIRGRIFVAALEIKLGARGLLFSPRVLENYNMKRILLGVSLFIVTDGDDYCVLSNDNTNYTRVTGFELIKCIQNETPVVSDPLPSQSIAKRIIELASNYSLERTIRFMEYHKDVFVSDIKSASICFDSACVEDSFFKTLLDSPKKNNLCRYTSIENVFMLIKSCQQNMCNLVCMNDRSEGQYADQKVFSRAMSVNENAFAESDECYILSFMDTSKSDDLTMWRLYGNDAEGVCLSYSIESSDLKRKQSFDNFFLAKVSYGEMGKNGEEHPELSFLRELCSYEFGASWRFALKRWGIWKHFFKSYLFSDEKEIRLLYHSENDSIQSEWILNSRSHIASKMLLFDIKNFPLKLNGVMLGPKCMENELVARQLSLMARENASLSSISFNTSKILIYR